MITCIESYTCICEILECSPSKRFAESLLILRQFKDLFEETDKMMKDPVLQEICRNLPEIHFGLIRPLDTKPIETIRKEYLKRSGKDLPEFLCHIAYFTFLGKDLEDARETAEEKAKTGQKTAETAEIIDAEKKQRELIDRFRKQCDEMSRKRKYPDAEGCTCGSGTYTCRKSEVSGGV